MRIFFDTEFIEDGKTIDLISIGLVAEDGRELYLENSECNLSRASPWVQENVLPHLTGDRVDRVAMGTAIRNFVDPERFGKPQFWAYYAHYDWVALCQLFGTMMDLPEGWPMYCRDFKQWLDEHGNPAMDTHGADHHNALADALHLKANFERLTALAAA